MEQEKWTVKSVDGEEQKSAQEVEQAVVEEATANNDDIQIEGSDDTIKVNLDQPETQEANEVTETPIEEIKEEPSEEVQPQGEVQLQEEEPVIELVTEEEPEPVAEAEPEALPQVLPEDVDKLVKFMDETGGTLDDYVSLNKDLDSLHPVDLVRDFYKEKYPHYNDERLERRMAKDFNYSEDEDPDVIQDRKDAFEDATFEAKKFLTERKDKYYSELKFNRNGNLPPEQKEAIDFYGEYQETQKNNEKLVEAFKAKTESVFNDEFKGFDFKVGDNKYRFKVGDVQKTKEYQSDLNNFIGDYAGEDGTIEDAAGYHKAMFAAKNADKIAQHFYEQGRADAIKQSAKESKNIDMTPRGDASSVVRTKTGTQFKVVSGESSNGLKIKMKK